LEAQNNVGANFCGINKRTLRRSFNLEIMFYGFPREKKHIWANSRKDGLVHSVCWMIYKQQDAIYHSIV
jgi:hypothetical protein